MPLDEWVGRRDWDNVGIITAYNVLRNNLDSGECDVLTLHDVLDNISDRDLIASSSGPLTGPIAGACVDSRQVKDGYLFIALPGERTDGHLFLADAVGRGANVLLVNRDYYTANRPAFPGVNVVVVDNTLQALQALARSWRRKHAIKVVGVTGSVGKTSTKELVSAVLSQRYDVLKNEENLNSEIGLPLTLLRLGASHERAVLEMAMYFSGDIALLCQIAEPEIGVVTNVGPSHMERMGSMENICRAKAELVESLPRSGVAILNADDALVRSMAANTKARVLFYGFDDGADVRAENVRSNGLLGVEFDLGVGRQVTAVRFPLPGLHSVRNALAATAVGLAEGFSLNEIRAGLEGVAQGARVKVVRGLNGSTIIDDSYNASPVSTIAALDLLLEMPGRKIAVLGDMYELGPFELEGHWQVGRRAAEAVDKLVAVGEKGRFIGEEAMRCGLADVSFAADTSEAAGLLAPELSASDYVLVKGSRGMRMEDIVERIKADR